VFDWVGVRFLVLDKRDFSTVPGRRSDHLALLDGPSPYPVPYEDTSMMILESTQVRTRAELWTGYTVRPTQHTVLAELRATPSRILESPLIEARDAPNNQLGDVGTPTGPQAIQPDLVTPNRVRLQVDAEAGDILVLKDIYAAGWSATVNGSPSPIVRVNGFARGVLMTNAGPQVVDFTYRPRSFEIGAWLGAACIAFMALGFIATRGRPGIPSWLSALGAILMVTVGVLSADAFLGLSTRSANAALMPNVDSLDVRYVPASLVAGARVVGDPTVPDLGIDPVTDAFVMSIDGTLFEIDGSGRLVPRQGRMGQRIVVTGAGSWDTMRQTMLGMPAIFDGTSWKASLSPVDAANANPVFSESTRREPLVGWTVEPANLKFTVQRMTDEHGYFVRVTAKESLAGLALTGRAPLADLDGVPLLARAEIRSTAIGYAQLVVFDEDGPGVSTTYMATSTDRGDWVQLVTSATQIKHPSPNDIFSVGVVNMNNGEYFDIREFSLFTISLPPALR